MGRIQKRKKKEKKKEKAKQLLQGCPCASAVIGNAGGGFGAGFYGSTQVPFFTPRPKMTKSINSRHVSSAPMESNPPDKQLKGFFLVTLTSHLDISISISHSVAMEYLSILLARFDTVRKK